MTTKTESKTAAPKKARKTAATKAAAPNTVTPPSPERVAELARQYWMERGRVDGFAEQDWIRAEQELAGVGA